MTGGHSQVLLSRLHHLYKENLLTDIELKCLDQRVSAHKVVLVTYSQLFHSLLLPENSPADCRIINLDEYDVRPSNVRAVVEYLYTGSVSEDVTDISGLLHDAQTLGISTLSDAVELTRGSRSRRGRARCPTRKYPARKNRGRGKSQHERNIYKSGGTQQQNSNQEAAVKDECDLIVNHKRDVPEVSKPPEAANDDSLAGDDSIDSVTKVKHDVNVNAKRRGRPKRKDKGAQNIHTRTQVPELNEEAKVGPKTDNDSRIKSVNETHHTVEDGDSKEMFIKCCHCSSIFVTCDAFETHTQEEHRVFQCGKCLKSFAKKAGLARHRNACRRHYMRQKATAEETLHSETNELGKESEEIKTDTESNTDESAQFLQKEVTDLTIPGSHFKKDGFYFCNKCSYRTKYNTNFKNHRFTHGSVKKFQCKLCKHCFKHKLSLDRHTLKCRATFKEKQSLTDSVCTDSKRKNKFTEVMWKKAKTSKSADGMYHCFKCEYSSRYCINVFRHIIAVHTTERPYKCPRCPMTFKQKDHMTRHIKSSCCIQQGQIRSTSSSPQSNIKTKTGAREAKVSSFRTSLRKNFSKLNAELGVDIENCKTEQGGYSCPRCSYHTSRRQYLQRHLVCHSNNKPHMCCVCGKSFKTRQSLKLHESKHTDGSEHQCEECGQSFLEASELRRHTLTSHQSLRPLTCTKEGCNYTSMDPQSFKRHLRNKHSTRSSSHKFLCELCGKYFSRANYLQNHVKVQHEGSPLLHPCSLCPFKTPHKQSIVVHMAHSHGLDQGGKPLAKKFKCDQCDYQCYWSSQLKTHMMRHEGKLPFKCNSCNYATNVKDSLTKHMRTHSQAKAFVCEQCGKRYNSQSGYRVHMMKHQDTAPYKCTMCDKGYMNKSSLIRHKFTHFNCLPYGCKLCSFECSQRDTLASHMTKVHKVKGHDLKPRVELLGDKDIKRRIYVKLDQESENFTETPEVILNSAEIPEAVEELTALVNVKPEDTVASFMEVATEGRGPEEKASKCDEGSSVVIDNVSLLNPPCLISADMSDNYEQIVAKTPVPPNYDASRIHYELTGTCLPPPDHAAYSGHLAPTPLIDIPVSGVNNKLNDHQLPTPPVIMGPPSVGLGSNPLANLVSPMNSTVIHNAADLCSAASVPQPGNVLPVIDRLSQGLQDSVSINMPTGSETLAPLPPLTSNIFSMPSAPPQLILPSVTATDSLLSAPAPLHTATTPQPAIPQEIINHPALGNASSTAGGSNLGSGEQSQLLGGNGTQIVYVERPGGGVDLVQILINPRDTALDKTGQPQGLGK